MNQLIQLAAQGGVIGGCGDLCGLLPNSLESTACSLICDYVGINAFSDALNYVDPDPVFTCMLIDICPKTLTASAVVVEAQLTPTGGKVGTSFNLGVQWNTTSPIATGQLAVVINGGQIDGLGTSQMIYGEADGTYSANFAFDTKPTKDNAWADGDYQISFVLCEGECGSVHEYSYTVLEQNIAFTLDKASDDGFDYHLYI
jgi:hypothetical protein